MRLKRHRSIKRAGHTVRVVATTMLVVALLLAGLLPRLANPGWSPGPEAAWMTICGHGGGADTPADAATHGGCDICCLTQVAGILPLAILAPVRPPMNLVRSVEPTAVAIMVTKGERPFARGPPALI